MGHLRNHSFTGTTDHDFTGLVANQALIYDGTNIVSTGSTGSIPTSGDLWSASTGTDSIIANNGSGNEATNNRALAGGFSTLASGDTSASWGINTTAGGQASHAEGRDSIASGLYSHAEGQGTLASGDESHAEGNKNLASGNASHAEGGIYNNEDSTPTDGPTSATTYSAHAEGDRTLASGWSSHAQGSNTTASGYYAHSEGLSTTSSAEASHAEGALTTAAGANSHAEGFRTIASGASSHAENRYTLAFGQGSHAGGEGSSPGSEVTASGRTSFAHFRITSLSGRRGSYADYSAILGGTDHNISNDDTSSAILGGSGNTIGSDEGILRTVIVGGQSINATQNDSLYTQNARLAENGGVIYSAGTDLYDIFGYSGSDTNLANTDLTLSANRQHYLAGNTLNFSGGNTGFGFVGPTSTVHISGDTTIGERAGTVGQDSLVIGGRLDLGRGALSQPPQASGYTSVAIGGQTTAGGNASIAAGLLTQAIGDYSVALGNQSIASAVYSFAMGQNSQASNTGAFAVGSGAIASGTYSVAFGQSVQATGSTSFAMGGGTRAGGLSSLATGVNTQANGSFTFAGGITCQAEGFAAFAIGGASMAMGDYSFAGGRANSFPGGVIASGDSSFVHFECTTGFPAEGTSGAFADNSAILGGRDQLVTNVANDSFIIGGLNNEVSGKRSGILGGNGLTNTLDDSVMVPGLQVEGFMHLKTVTAATNYNTTSEVIIGINDTSVARTVTVDSADISEGRIFIIKDESGGAGTNNITIATGGAETIDGAANIKITANYGVARVYCGRDGNLYTF